MRKTHCDRCGKACGESWNTIAIPCHIAEYTPTARGYADVEGNAASGRKVEFDLCNACANVVYVAAFKAMKTGGPF